MTTHHLQTPLRDCQVLHLNYWGMPVTNKWTTTP